MSIILQLISINNYVLASCSTEPKYVNRCELILFERHIDAGPIPVDCDIICDMVSTDGSNPQITVSHCTKDKCALCRHYPKVDIYAMVKEQFNGGWDQSEYLP